MDCCGKSNVKEPASRCSYDEEQKTIYLFLNGEEYKEARIYTIYRKEARDWGALLQQITDVLKPKNGYIRTLCTSKGKPVRHYNEIQNRMAYVAVSTWEPFRPCEHVENYTKIVSPRPFKVSNLKSKQLVSKHAEPIYVTIPTSYDYSYYQPAYY